MTTCSTSTCACARLVRGIGAAPPPLCGRQARRPHRTPLSSSCHPQGSTPPQLRAPRRRRQARRRGLHLVASAPASPRRQPGLRHPATRCSCLALSAEYRCSLGAPAAAQAVLLDIEGTVTPISFVTNVLFPYARERVRPFLERGWEDAEVRAAMEGLCEQAAADAAAGLDGAVSIPAMPGPESAAADGKVSAFLDAVARSVEWQMDGNRKSGPLKQLQGLIWRRGYAEGHLCGQVYADVVPALKSWTEGGVKVRVRRSASRGSAASGSQTRLGAGRQVYIYSSGSREAQRLLFGHCGELPASCSATGADPALARSASVQSPQDVRPLLSGFFDLSSGCARGSPPPSWKEGRISATLRPAMPYHLTAPRARGPGPSGKVPATAASRTLWVWTAWGTSSSPRTSPPKPTPPGQQVCSPAAPPPAGTSRQGRRCRGGRSAGGAAGERGTPAWARLPRRPRPGRDRAVGQRQQASCGTIPLTGLSLALGALVSSARVACTQELAVLTPTRLPVASSAPVSHAKSRRGTRGALQRS